MAVPRPLPLDGKVLAELLRSDNWSVEVEEPNRLRIDHVQGLNVEPVCVIVIDAMSRRVEVNAPYPTNIPPEMADAVSEYMHAVTKAIQPVRWAFDRQQGHLVLTYVLVVPLPETESAELVLGWETKRKVRTWAQGCIDMLDRYASGLNGILAGMPLAVVSAQMARAEIEDAMFDANWTLHEGEHG